MTSPMQKLMQKLPHALAELNPTTAVVLVTAQHWNIQAANEDPAADARRASAFIEHRYFGNPFAVPDPFDAVNKTDIRTIT